MTKLVAKDLLELLRVRHADALFIPECKNGPTHYGSHRRLDAWVMAKSWANPTLWGYEIKVSRSDFLQDNKWPDYLSMCNELYFVCPSGLIAPEEIPDGVGLLWAAKTGTRLYCKRKAPHRDIQFPEDVFRYVLMCRAKVTDEHGMSGREYWERWLEDKELDFQFGQRVSRSIATLVAEQVTTARKENGRLESLMSGYDRVREILVELGIDPSEELSWQIKNKIAASVGVLPDDLQRALERAESALRQAIEKISVVKDSNGTLR